MDERDLVTPEEEALERARIAEFNLSPEGQQRRERSVAGRKHKRKGDRVERHIVELLELIPGVRARRQPGSGALEAFPHDLELRLEADEAWRMSGEVKARKGGVGFKQLERWRAGADVLILARDQERPGQKRPDPDVFLSWELFSELLEAKAELTRLEGTPPPDR